MYSAQQPDDTIWRGDKLPAGMLYTDIKTGTKEGIYFSFTAVKQACKIPYFIRKRYHFLPLLIIFILQSFSPVQAQDETDYAVHANIIYHFTKYIDWPAGKKTGEFIIGVAGDTPLFDALKRNVSHKRVGNQEIVIKRVKGSDADFTCHILFISDDESNNMKKIVSRTAGNSILLVSESEGFTQKGGCINFVILSDHLKLEINKINIEQRNLHIASDLLQLGKIIK